MTSLVLIPQTLLLRTLFDPWKTLIRATSLIRKPLQCDRNRYCLNVSVLIGLYCSIDSVIKEIFLEACTP